MPDKPGHRATRGHGVLEAFLARKRRDKALALLRPFGPIERVLDIGCGAYPLLLKNVRAAERVGIDQGVTADVQHECAADGIRLIAHDIVHDSVLPFADDHFDAVTMLAVVEHISLDTARAVTGEVRRVLKPGGVFVLTTPASWTDIILRTMARLSLVSAEEIDEHKSFFTRAELVRLLQTGGFETNRIASGTFELRMNLWASATK